MRCPTCDHALWNVRGRICPECGNPFDPTTMSLKPNCVEFCCPGCEQPYYGTDHNGLIIPQEFLCVTCGQFCSLRQNMFMRLAPGAEEGGVDANILPWVDSRVGPGFMSWFRTMGRCIGSPSRVGNGLRTSPHGRALTYVISLAVPLLLAILALIFFFIGIDLMTRSSGRYSGVSGSMLGDAAESAGISIAVAMVGLFAAVTLSALLSWWVLSIGGCRTKFGVVFCCWAFGATPVAFAPFTACCPYCFWLPLSVWIVILAGIMIAHATDATPGLAVFAAIAPAIAVGVGLFLLMIVLYSSIMWARRAAPGPVAPGAPAAQTSGDSGPPEP